MRYAVVIEKANGNYSAYVPDLPGCVATGKTVSLVEEEIRAAIRFHIEGLKADGLTSPPLPASPTTSRPELSPPARRRWLRDGGDPAAATGDGRRP